MLQLGGFRHKFLVLNQGTKFELTLWNVLDRGLSVVARCQQRFQQRFQHAIIKELNKNVKIHYANKKVHSSLKYWTYSNTGHTFK